jgi:hypothetical protein
MIGQPYKVPNTIYTIRYNSDIDRGTVQRTETADGTTWTRVNDGQGIVGAYIHSDGKLYVNAPPMFYRTFLNNGQWEPITEAEYSQIALLPEVLHLGGQVAPPPPALTATSNGVDYRLQVRNGRIEIAISTGEFAETAMANILSARFDDPWIIALLTNGTYQKMRVTDRLFVLTDLYEPNLKAQYDTAVTANKPLVPGTAAIPAPTVPVNAILPSTAAELEMQRRQNHVNGGRSFAVTTTSGVSPAILISLNAGITVAAISGTATVYQTSSSLAHVQTSQAVWETWSLGTTATAGKLSGNIQNATAVYLESIGGVAIMSIRD